MSPEAVDLLIEARWVLPIAPVNTVLTEHAVAVSGGRIVALGPALELNRRYSPRERVVRPDHALLPGLVNAHTRAAMRLLRGLPVHGPLLRWRCATVQPVEQRCLSPDFVRDGTQLAIAEMLRAGITAFADEYLFPEEAARAASAARVRAAIGLPVAEAPSAWAESANAYLARAERLWDEYQSDPWVSLYFAPESTALGEATLARVRRVADELDARVAMRVHESAVQVHDSLAQFGGRPLGRLRKLGLLQPGFTAVHMNCIEDEDLQTISGTGICVVACTQSDLRLGGSAAPLKQLSAQGFTVGLGTNDPVSAGALDVLAEARASALMCNGDGSAGRLSAEEVLYMATLGGARALGLSAHIGSLEPGKAADLVCLDLSDPGCRPRLRPADSIVFGATRAQASDVWISGRAAVAAGHLLALDEQELSALERDWARRVPGGVES